MRTFSVVGNMIHNANTRYYHKGRCHLVQRVDITNLSLGGENRHYSATRWKELTLLFCQLVERISTSRGVTLLICHLVETICTPTCQLVERIDTTTLLQVNGEDNVYYYKQSCD